MTWRPNIAPMRTASAATEGSIAGSRGWKELQGSKAGGFAQGYTRWTLPQIPLNCDYAYIYTYIDDRFPPGLDNHISSIHWFESIILQNLMVVESVKSII